MFILKQTNLFTQMVLLPFDLGIEAFSVLWRPVTAESYWTENAERPDE